MSERGKYPFMEPLFGPVNLKLEEIRWAVRLDSGVETYDHGAKHAAWVKALIVRWPESVGHVEGLEDDRDHVVRWLTRRMLELESKLRWRRKYHVWPILRPLAWMWSRPVEAFLQAGCDRLRSRWPIREKRWYAYAVVGDLSRIPLPREITKDMFPVFLNTKVEAT